MALTPAQLARLSRLLDEALALAPHERAAWLAGLQDEPLAPRLRPLLSLPDGAAGPLSTLPRLPDPATEPAPAGLAGERVGSWRLLREIGRGGMGSVWLAERADGVFDRLVALKLPRIAWSEGLTDRMAQERRIGARLEHPAIARLYDAGLDERGRPYIAMEFIDGVPIDAWVRQQRLGPRETLRLVVQVVRAVAYAHGQLVVHRDLKPSNVLVGPDGAAHLLDFGIAKRLDAGDGASTQDQGRALTPHYAAPEQIAGGPVGVQADVYSLGVLLYELLTGTLPYRPQRATLGALEQAILDGDPPLASSRVEDRRLAHALRGEVDAILARALQREPAARYATADALADDIERHLRGEAVVARPDSPWQRWRRLLARHRVPVAAGGLVLLALLGGGALALLQAQRATQALAREQQARALVGELIRVDTQGLSQEQVLQRQADTLRERLPDEPALQAELFGLLASTFAELGMSHLAADHATRQLALLGELRAPAGERGRALLQLARAQLENQRLGDAERHAREALALAAQAPTLDAEARVLLVRVLTRQSRREEAGRVMDGLEATAPSAADAAAGRPALQAAWLRYLQADAQRRGGDFAAALPGYEAAIALAQRAGPAGRSDAAQMQLDLAYELIVRNQRAQALALMEPALAVLAGSGPSGAVNAASQRAALVTNMALMGQVPVAEALDTLQALRRALGARGGAVAPVAQARLDFHRARLLGQRGQVQEAMALLDGAVPVLLEVTAWANARYSLVNAHGRMAMHAGEHERARDLLAHSLRLREEMGHARIPFAAVSHAYVALNEVMAGRHDEAARALDAAPVFEAERSDPVSGAVYATLLPWQRARLHLERGERDAAVALAQRLGRGEEDPDTDFLSPTAVHAEIACASDRAAEGLAQLQAMIGRRQAQVDAADPTLARLRAQAGLCLLALGRAGPARALAVQAAAAFAAQPGVSPWFKAPLLRLQQRLDTRPARA